MIDNKGKRDNVGNKYHEDEDTDEEIERVMNEEKERSRKEHRKKDRKEGTKHEEETSDEESPKKNREERRKKRRSGSKGEKRRSQDKTKKEKNRSGGSGSDAAYDADTDKENNSPQDSGDAYEAETDVDEDNRKDALERVSSAPLIKFKDIFKGDVMLLKGFEDKEYKLLDRYIVGYGGTVSMYNSPSVGIIITKFASPSQLREAGSINTKVEVVRPEWIFKCVDKQEKVPTHQFIF